MYQVKKANAGTASRIAALLLSAVLMLSAALTLTACGDNTATDSSATDSSAVEAPDAIELQIFAANSLEKALPAVQALYTAQNPNVTFADTQFKGSGDLVTELQGGAPADLLITASSATMDKAVENGSIDESTRVNMFGNDLVVVKQEGSDIAIATLADVNNSTITKIAIGDADAVPAGAYANQSLNTLGLYTDASGKGGSYEESFAAKVLIQSSVGNVAKTVSTGDAQIGFVYTSDLYRYEGIEQVLIVPTDAHKSIVYPGAVAVDSAESSEAAAFLEFCLNDPDALKIWAQYGFELV